AYGPHPHPPPPIPYTTLFRSIEEALDALRAGLPVLVVDDEDRENEGDVVLAAETLTTEWLAWTIRHTSGYLCAPLPNDLADRLRSEEHTSELQSRENLVCRLL